MRYWRLFSDIINQQYTLQSKIKDRFSAGYSSGPRAGRGINQGRLYPERGLEKYFHEIPRSSSAV